MERDVPDAEPNGLHLIECIDSPHAENVGESRCEATVRNDPDAGLAGPVVESQLTSDDFIAAAEITEMDAQVDRHLGENRIEVRRCASDHAIAALNDRLEHVRIAHVQLKRPELLALNLFVQRLKGPRTGVADLNLSDFVARGQVGSNAEPMAPAPITVIFMVVVGRG
jgi:hypothetical protein